MKRAILIFAVALTIALVGCYKNDIVHTYHPETGLVVLMVEPPDLEEGEVMPTSYFIEVAGVRGEVVDGKVTFASLVEPGTYDVHIYNETNAISVGSDGVASVPSSEDDVAELSDEHCYFGAGTITISADYNDLLEVDVTPMTRKLTFELAVSEGEAEKVQSIDMTFTGVAGSWHCLNNETVGTAKSVNSTFEVVSTAVKADEDTGYTLKSSMYLLGLIGDEHNLEITVHYETGHKQVITSTITSELDDFNEDKSTSKVLTSQTALLTETSQNGTINDWEVADESFDFDIGPGESLKQ